ncbi:hypothetical protein [Variovorax guangxiensis]|uniref:Uncharacterized protein n=1 Tax=Variovorax guangxiensis TaxID=1775474 RepID=A0A840FX10_9BURK|nr:hypothetical protein [Variovorax guangxiensis]MBB4223959.1 hypothetical protein [Variovorax guangxiensis]
MLSAELAADIKSLLEGFQEANTLFEGLKLIQATEQQMEAPMRRMAVGGNEANAGANDIHALLAHARGVLPKMPPRAFFKAIDAAGATLGRFLAAHSDPTGRLFQLRENLDEFALAFETFSTDQTGKNALPVLRLGARLLIVFETVTASYAGMLQELESGLETREDEESISFCFSGDFSLDEMAKKLAALNQIIEAIASLVLGDATRPSSRVLKLESGSLGLDLAVLKSVSSILKPYLSAVVGYFYRNHIPEGRIRSVPSDAKAAIKSAIDVRVMLQKAGIDTTRMDDQLEIAGMVMAESVVMLLKDQVGFKMGGSGVSSTEIELAAGSRGCSARTAKPRRRTAALD